MKWFQHSTDSHDDPDIADAEDEFGDAGYSVFFKILEIYGREFNSLDDSGWMRVSQAFLRRKLRKSWKKVEQILNFYQERERIFFVCGKIFVSINIPNFLKKSSNWTKRIKSKPTEVPTEEPQAKETEEEKETDNKEPFRLPTQEEISESSKPKLTKDIDELCKKLYDEKIFSKVYAFKNKMLKQNKNERTILHALSRCYIKRRFKDGEAWAYCLKIMQIEDGNYNERDYHKTIPEGN